MKPEVILTGMVSTQLSSSGSSLISEEFDLRLFGNAHRCNAVATYKTDD